MGFTSKYELEEISYGMTGWNAILWANMQLVDDHLHTRLDGIAGEIVAAYEAGYLKADEKYWKAQANKSKMPALGLFIEAAAADAAVRLQRVGPITNGSWSWAPGKPVYLSATTPGALTQVRPPIDQSQLMGIASSATTLILCGTIDLDALPTTTTTTTTTTSTTTSTTTTSSTTTTTA